MAVVFANEISFDDFSFYTFSFIALVLYDIVN